MTYITDKLLTYIEHKSDLTPKISSLYKNSLIFIKDEQQLYNPLTDTYVGIGLTNFRHNSIIYINGNGSSIGNWFGSSDQITELYEGLSIIYVPDKNGISSGTTLNINNLGNVNCYYNNSRLTTHYAANTPILFTYINNTWKASSDYNSNSNTFETETKDTSTDASYYIGFFNRPGNVSKQYAYVTNKLYFNPLTYILSSYIYSVYDKKDANNNIIGTGYFYGDLVGTSTYTKIFNQSNGTYYLTFTDGNGNNRKLNIDNNSLLFDANTNTLTVSNLNGNASSSTNTSYFKVSEKNNTNTANNTSYTLVFSSGTSSYVSAYVSSNLKYNPINNTLITSIFQGNLKGNADTATASNTSIYSQNTYTSLIKADAKGDNTYYIALFNKTTGQYSYSYISGLTYNPHTNVLSGNIIKANTYFEGDLHGNATTATSSITSTNSKTTYSFKVDEKNSTNTANNTSYTLVFSSGTSSYVSAYVSSNLKYNPITNTLITSIFQGNLNGNADTATASNTSIYSQNTYTNLIKADAKGNNTYYIPLINKTTGQYSYTYLSGLSYNPHTNVLSGNIIKANTYFEGDLHGNATTSTSSITSTNSKTTYSFKVDEKNSTNTANNTSYTLVFSSGTSSYVSAYVSSNLKYNPITNTLITSIFQGNLKGNADTATASNTSIYSQNTYTNLIKAEAKGNNTYYIALFNKTIGQYSYSYISGLSYNPSTNTLSGNIIKANTYFEGDLHGNATTATSSVTSINSKTTYSFKVDEKNSTNTANNTSYTLVFSSGTSSYVSAYVSSNLKYDPVNQTLITNDILCNNIKPSSNNDYNIGTNSNKFTNIFGQWFSGISQYTEILNKNTEKFYFVGSSGTVNTNVNDTDLSNRKLKYDTNIYTTNTTGQLVVKSLLINTQTIGVNSVLSISGNVDIDGNITANNFIGNATSADKLNGTNSYTAWGQEYWSNGIPKTISGDMTSVGNVTPSNNNTKLLGSSANNWKVAYTNSVHSNSTLYLNSAAGTSVIVRINNGTELARFSTNGNVGIGTTSPSQKLHVNGNLLVNSNIYIKGTKNRIYSDGDGTNICFEVNSKVMGVFNASENAFRRGQYYPDITLGTSVYPWKASYAGLSYADGFHHNEHDSNDYVILAGGGTKPLNEFAGSHPHPYLPLAGGTMTGKITRIYSTASNEPMISLESNNQDIWLWRIKDLATGTSSDTSKVYGFGLKYKGTGNGNENDLELWADNQAGTAVKVFNVHQDGTLYFGATNTYIGTSKILTEANIKAILPINGNTIAVKINSYTSPYITVPYATNSDYSLKSTNTTNTSYFKVSEKNSTNTANNTAYTLIFSSGTSSYVSAYVSSNLKYNPITNTLITSIFQGNLKGNADTATASNTSIYSQNTYTSLIKAEAKGNNTYYIALFNKTTGQYSYSYISGLTYNPHTNVLSGNIIKANTYFEGDLHGNATTSTSSITSINSKTTYSFKVDEKNSTNTANNTAYTLVFSSGTSSYVSAYVSSNLKYNPITNTLITSIFQGNLKGNADTATSSNTSIYSQNTYTNLIKAEAKGNNTYYIPLINKTTGQYSYSYISGLTYNPHTNVLSGNIIKANTYFEGDLHGNATTATSSITSINSKTTYQFKVDEKNSTNTANNTSYTLVFSSGTSSYVSAYVSSNLKYNPINSTLETINIKANTGTFSDQIESTLANGTAPLKVKSTTVNTNFNADLLDGYHAGNGNGNIPISNSTLNTNLNADLLDGYHQSSFVPLLRYNGVSTNTWFKVRINVQYGCMFSITIKVNGGYVHKIFEVSGYNYTTNKGWHLPKASCIADSECSVSGLGNTIVFGKDNDGEIWFAVYASGYNSIEIIDAHFYWSSIPTNKRDAFTVTLIAPSNVDNQFNGIGTVKTTSTVAILRSVYSSYFKVSEKNSTNTGNNTSYSLVFSSNNLGNVSAYVSNNLKYDPVTNTTYSLYFDGQLEPSLQWGTI